MMDCSEKSRLITNLYTDLINCDDRVYHLTAYTIVTNKGKKVNKTKKGRWTGVRDYNGYLQFIFSNQQITLKVNKNTYAMIREPKDPVSIIFSLSFKKGRKIKSIKLYVVNTSVVSTKLNYIIPPEAKSLNWLMQNGKPRFTVEKFKELMEPHKDRLLYQVLLDTSIIYGLSGAIVSETFYVIGYKSDQTVEKSNLDRIYEIIITHLQTSYYLDGTGIDLYGEKGEFSRNFKIVGKTETIGSDLITKVPVEKMRYKEHTLFFVK